MNVGGTDDSIAWSDAALAAALFAIDPAGTGGVAVRAPAGPAREEWLGMVRAWLAPAAPWRRVPLGIADDRLLGGLELAATLRAGRPVAARGLLAEADGGVVVLAMAERLPVATAARLAAVMDTGAVRLERDGVALCSSARIGVIALDEGMFVEERPPAAILDRLAFQLDFGGMPAGLAVGAAPGVVDIAAARARLPLITVDDALVEALCAAAAALGIDSARAALLALKVARAAAALAGHSAVEAVDAAQAARLVLAPRATVQPPPPEAEAEPAREQPGAAAEPAPPQAATPREDAVEESPDAAERPLDDVVLAAAQAAIPAGLLAHLQSAQGRRTKSPAPGRAGCLQKSTRRGRPIGVERGELRAGARLNVLATLRAAAPWQRLRRRAAGAGVPARAPLPRIEVRREDFRVTQFKQRAETTTIFAVDASGSAALHRLAEAKGAVELLLADCYVRRDRVALIAFRGSGAELLLPPTRSLARAKRGLAGLPGGGGTPLAAGIDAATALAAAARRRGETPTIVLLTDGRANIARDGAAGRVRAEAEALAAARALAAAQCAVLFVDMSPRAQPQARQLASAMRARYLALPYAAAAAISQAVRASAALDNTAPS